MISDRRIHRNIFLNVILTFLGIILVLGGGFTIVLPVQLFLIGMGSAVLGAAMGGYFSLLRNLDLTELILEAVSSQQRASVVVEQNLTSAFRKRYYHYHATVVSGQRCWVLAIFDFSQEFAPGGLRCKTSFIAGDRRPMDYTIYGLFLGRSLILSDNIDIGPRCTHIEIFPFFAESYAAVAHGFLFHENWDAQPQISPALLAQQPLDGISGPGQIDDTNAKKLDLRWANQVKAGEPLNLDPSIFQVDFLVRPPTPVIH